MAGPERLERPTPSFVAKCSIQLSYGPVKLIVLWAGCEKSGQYSASRPDYFLGMKFRDAEFMQ